LGIASAVGLAGVVAANWWVDRKAMSSVHCDVDTAPERQVAIVPGAGVRPDGVPSAILEDRLAAALALYEAQKVRKILVSGDHHARAYDETNAMQRWLVERGVPDEDVFMDHAGVRTFDTMERAAKVFVVRSAIVCTQQFHLYRSVFLARRAGIDAVGLAVDRRVYLHAERHQLRETLAKTLAVADTYLLRTRARHLGDVIPINGDGRVTHDGAADN